MLREGDESEPITDIDADAQEFTHVTRHEALKAADILQAYTSDHGDHLACTLKAAL